MAKLSDDAGNLTDQQMRFVTEYMKDCNGKQAAIRAGYSKRTAEAQASRLLSNAKVENELKARQEKLRQENESVSEKIRRRLWEESEDYSEFASHSARIKALELLGKIYGEFERDNKQKTDPLLELVSAITGAVKHTAASDDDDED